MFFNTRSAEPELMDGKDISYEEFYECLESLEKINTLTLAYRPTLRWVSSVMKVETEDLVILDAGSGGGDMLRRIADMAEAQNCPIELVGVDLNPWAQKSATQMTGGKLKPQNIQYKTADIFSYQHNRPIDLIICSLFTHHLSEVELIRFLKWLDKTAQKGWFINDLHRHPIPWGFIKVATRLFSRNRLIRHDAPVSVARAFKAKDWRRLLTEAGIEQDRVRISWHFPFRYCLSCRK
ncbi:MAG: methyltransferase domain-containing protein [Pseudomonadota bacterium]